MKKFLTLFVAVLVATMTVSAKDYKHSIGLVGGLGIGAQYKTMVTDHFTIITELGYFVCPKDTKTWYYRGVPIANGVFAYQTKTLAEGEGIKLSVYAGTQVKLGYVFEGHAGKGLFGAGGVVGFEGNIIHSPIAFSLDFRPGYAMTFYKVGYGMDTYHMFDYSINLGIRYTL